MLVQENLFKLFSATPRAVSRPADQEMFLVLQTPPEGFISRKGNFGTCAHHSLKAVIEAKTREKKSLHDYSCDWWSRLTYLMTPWGLQKMLRKYEINFSIIQARKLTSSQKIALLKQALLKGPVILLIGNGITNKKFFSRKKALTHWHYVTLWGYHEKEEVFFIYDSNTKRSPEVYLMRGTIKIPYQDIVKCRSIGATKLLYNYAIAVEY